MPYVIYISVRMSPPEITIIKQFNHIIFTTLNLSANIPEMTPSTIETNDPMRLRRLRFFWATSSASAVPEFARAFVM